MSSSAMQLLQLIVNSTWSLFTRWKLPGLGFTPAQFVAFLLIFPLVLDFVSSILSGATSTLPGRINASRRQSNRDSKRG